MKILLICICFITSAVLATPTVVAVFGGEECPWSVQLKAEIWDHPDFQKILQREGIEQQVVSANGADTPTLILRSSLGEEIGRLGYLLISPEKYGELLVEMLQIEKIPLEPLEVAQLLKLYKRCRLLNMQSCSENILKEGLAKDKGTDFLVEHYITLCKDHPRKARKIKQEIRSRRPKVAEIEWQMAVAYFEAHPKAKTLEKYLRRFGEQAADRRFQCHLLLGEYYKEQNQLTAASRHIQEAIAQAPEELKALIVPLEVR